MLPADFTRFMQEVHGHDPFPWQTSTVEKILETGSWPSLVDVPTGMGKTAMLDIAVFVLAMSVGDSVPRELGRRRIFFVVDRRIVVDQAEEHGLRIAHVLTTAAPGSISFEIARRLRELSGLTEIGPALSVVKMRGGVTWEAAWLPRPDLPAIITGTVDQVGSRLFFRGYGVSSRRRPIDAALVGTDSVIMIDEAHLSQAFTSSLAAAHSVDSSQSLGLPPTSVVHLSATNVRKPSGWFVPFNEDAHLKHPTAQVRLTAPKTLSLVNTVKKDAVSELVKHTVAAVNDGSRVLVACNTVDRAREVHKQLEKLKTLPPGTEVLLLMGRSRPLDREIITKRVLELFGASRNKSADTAVLVATQTVEVGIDIDATALVTEAAAWDALVQRIGRVNRRGILPSARIVVIDDHDEKPPVYGDAKIATSAFLESAIPAAGELDVSPLALRHLVVPPALTSRPPMLPLLLPAQLDAWARTSPAPSNDPPLDPYLHGIDRSLAPVTVAWRKGLLDSQGERLSYQEAGSLIDAIPLRAEESVEIPLGALCRWLLNKDSVPVSDLDDYDSDIPFGNDAPDHLVLRRTEKETGLPSWVWVSGDMLRPGDMIVVPAEMGGLDNFGWNPASDNTVHDVAELAALRRGQVTLRLDSDLPTRLGVDSFPELEDLVQDWRNCDDSERRDELESHIIELIRTWVIEYCQTINISFKNLFDSPWHSHDFKQLCSKLEEPVALTQTNEYSFPILRVISLQNNWLIVDERNSDETSHLNQKVTLATHLDAVGQRADDIARHLRIPAGLRQVIVDAARWHDLGKAEIRFQAMLFGGDPIRAELADEPLAKSGMPPGDRKLHHLAKRLSGLPQGARHEAWSEALVNEYIAHLPEAYPGDAELLCHLIATHHGHGRPFLPIVADSAKHSLEAKIDGKEITVPLPIGVQLSHADRFARLNNRYGRWGLALLETIVRCADMTVSSEGS